MSTALGVSVGRTVADMSRHLDLAAVVLAGGASRRMGRDKATLRWCGETLIARTVRVVGDRCEPVAVVKAPSQDFGPLDAVLLDDDEPGQGPLAALACGLRRCAALGAQRAFVCAVDMPLLAPGLVDELAAGGADIVVAMAGGRDHFLAAIYRTELCAAIETLVRDGERRLGALVESVCVQRILISDPAWVTNVNTEEELGLLT